jgi:hypothetical protein
MSSLNNRLQRLEQAARTKADAYKVVYKDPETPGVFWDDCPFSADPGQQYSEADLEGLAETVIIIQYEKRPIRDD